MKKWLHNKTQLLITLAIIMLLLIGTAIIVFYGMGYRFSFGNGKPELSGTGLLVATSIPNGAQVFINDHLTTATDNTINLAPGMYKIKIFKEGYFPWEKEIKIQKEVVSKAEALLFPTAPKLESITAQGVQNPIIDPSLTRLAYTVSSQSARKNGVYILDMSQKPILTLQSASTQIADDTFDVFSKSNLSWSPDGTQLLATISGDFNQTTYILEANSFNETPKDITTTLPSVETLWTKYKQEREKTRFASLKPKLKSLISTYFTIRLWSQDDTKILYEASTSGTLPLVITPRIIGFDTTPEQRTIEKGTIYVYDTKEDKNYFIGTYADSNDYSLQWFPDSKHLIVVDNKKIEIVEYDGKNPTTIYAGPFVNHFAFPWTNESKIVVLTNLGNDTIPPNLYTISLK